jgi:hypothetical protein
VVLVAHHVALCDAISLAILCHYEAAIRRAPLHVPDMAEAFASMRKVVRFLKPENGSASKRAGPEVRAAQHRGIDQAERLRSRAYPLDDLQGPDRRRRSGRARREDRASSAPMVDMLSDTASVGLSTVIVEFAPVPRIVAIPLHS